MRKYTINPVLDMETLEWVSNDGVYYSDEPCWSFGGGASAGDTANLQNEQKFMKEFSADMESAYSTAGADLSAVKNQWDLIANQGAYQYGYSSAEDMQMRQDIETQGAEATANSVAAEQLRQQQLSGGAAVMPQGAEAALEAQVRVTGAEGTAAELAQERESGYALGAERFNEAMKGEQAVADVEANLTKTMAGATTEEGKNVNEAQQIVDQANANSLTNKLLGGLIGAGMSFATGGLSNILGGGSFLNPGSNPTPTVATPQSFNTPGAGSLGLNA